MGLRWRLALVVLAVVLAGDWWLVDRSVTALHRRYREAMETGLVDTAALLAGLVEADLVRDGPDATRLAAVMASAAQRRIDATIFGHRVTAVATGAYLTNQRGVVLYHSADPTQVGQDHSRWNDVARTLAGRYGSRATRTDPADPRTSVHHVAMPVRQDGRCVGVLSVFRPVGSLSPLIAEARFNLIVSGCVAGLGAVVMVLLTTWWITRPLRRLMEHVAAVKAGGRPPLPPLGSDEMGRLGAAFDDLCASLDGRAYIERYVQTLTHELKSPLAAIRGAAELLDEDLPPDDRRRFLANIRTETGRLQDLAERLLELAALERRSEALRNDTIAAEALIADVVESLHPQTVTKGVAVQVTIHPGIAVRGERFLIRQALANLLQNAIAFSPAGGVITIAAQPQDGRTAISIRDQGPGIPDFAHERIFERFFSLARPDTGRKGTGLGLTFVREVALRHGGTITLANHPDGGAIADLRLPGAISADGR